MTESIPKGYQKTEIGIIPENWEVKRLGNYAEMSSGGTPITTNKSYYGGNIPWVVIADMTRIKKYLFETEKNITEKGLLNSSTKLFKKNTLLFAMYASIGKCAIAKVEVSCNQAILGINSNKLDIEYLYYYLASNEKRFLQMGQTGTQNNLNKEIVQNLLIPFPKSKQEQSAIASVLSDTDELIESLTKLIEKKKNIKQGAMQELLTGKKILPGFTGEWEEKVLGEISNIKTGKRNGNEEVDEGKYPFFVRSQKVKKINSYSFDGEAILIPGEGGIGTIIHYINGKFDYHQRVYKISNFVNSNCAKFIYYSLIRNFENHATKNSVKATVDSLRLPTFLEFKFPSPKDPKEQSAIASILSSMDLEIEQLDAKRDKYVDLKQGMMQELLTGRIRLKCQK